MYFVVSDFVDRQTDCGCQIIDAFQGGSESRDSVDRQTAHGCQIIDGFRGGEGIMI